MYTPVHPSSVPLPTLSGKLVYNLCHWSCANAYFSVSYNQW